jgi:hypothetical protein
MKNFFFILIFLSLQLSAQMPNISRVFLNEGKPYIGSISEERKKLTLKIDISEQNRKNDQQYYVSGFTVVDNTAMRFEGTITITEYKDRKKRSIIYGIYDFAEENNGPHSGKLTGKFVYKLNWNKKTERPENQDIKFTGDWINYDKTMHYKTELSNGKN